MRLFTLLVALLFAHGLIGQSDQLISYSCDNKSLERVFSELEEAYNLRFSYATNTLEDETIDLDIHNASLENVLKQLIPDALYDFKIVDDNVLIRKTQAYTVQENEGYRTSIHLQGSVTDVSKTDLPFATLYVTNSSIGTYTDEMGGFDLEIPNRYLDEKLIISYVGFEEKVIQIADLENQTILIELEEGELSVEEIVIVNRKKPLRIVSEEQSMRLTERQLQSLTSGLAGADLSRQLQLLPGIASHDDTSSDIKIRGSNADETLLILDGMPLYNVNHYFGIFSSINTSYIDEVNIYKNNIPLEYGGKTAGVVEVKSSDDLPEKTSLNANINLLSAGLDISTPLSDNLGLSLAGRTTYRNVSNTQFNTFAPQRENSLQVGEFSEDLGNASNDPAFRFYDVNGKLIFRPSGNQRLTFNLFASSDQLETYAEQSIKDRKQSHLDLSVDEEEQWSNWASTVEYEKSFDNGVKLKSSAIVTRYNNTAELDYQLKGENRQGKEFEKEWIGMSQYNRLENLGANFHATLPLGADSLQLGVSYAHYNIDYEFLEDERQKLYGDNSVNTASIYGEYGTKLLPQLNLTAGVRGTYYDLTQKMYLSPRVHLNYELSKYLSLKSSFGIYPQFVRELKYEYRGETKKLWVNSGDNKVPVLYSQNAMVGLTARLGIFLLDVEGYRKDMSGVLEYAVIRPGRQSMQEPRAYALYSGKGISQGIDILLSAGYQNYDTYLSYTLSELKYSFEQIARGMYFAAEDDRRHQFKWVNSYTWNNFTFGMDAVYISGRPYTNLRAFGPDGEIRNNINQRYLPAYTRMDIGISYDFRLKSSKASLGISVFNLWNTQNVKYIHSVVSQFENDKKPINTIIGSESNLLSRTLNLSLKIEI